MERNSTSSSASSEMWGSETVRLDNSYHILVSSSIQERNETSAGYARLIMASRYGRKVMLKALKEEVRGVLQYEELLLKEFEILVSLTHDNIVKVLSMDEIEGLGQCIVMEYVGGVTLSQWLEQPTCETMDETKHAILAEIFRAVDYMHSRGVLHRDLTPTNIIVQPDDCHIRIIDFGFADSASFEILKQPCGTQGYVAPEQREGISDIRNDIYSLGCIMQAMQLDSSYTPIVDKCLLPLDERPASVRDIMQAMEQIRQKKISRKTIVQRYKYLFLLLPVLCITAYAGWKTTHYGRTAISPMAEDQVMAAPPADSNEISAPPLSPPANTNDASTRGIQPPLIIEPSTNKGQQSSVNTLLEEGQKMIDADVRVMHQIMDTVSRKEYLPPSYHDFQLKESKKIHQFATSHQDEIPASDFTTFYDSLFSYYSNHYTAKWYKRLKVLYAE